MKKMKRLHSDCGKNIIEIVRDDKGAYLLLKFIRKYDSEEDKSYEVRELPDPSGRYESLESAIEEAKRILGV